MTVSVSWSARDLLVVLVDGLNGQVGHQVLAGVDVADGGRLQRLALVGGVDLVDVDAGGGHVELQGRHAAPVIVSVIDQDRCDVVSGRGDVLGGDAVAGVGPP